MGLTCGSWSGDGEICALIRGSYQGGPVAAYVRKVKTAPAATAVQIVHSSRRGSRDTEHLGPAADDAELEVLKAAARYRLTAGKGRARSGSGLRGRHASGGRGGPLPITSSRMGHLVDALIHAYRVLGF